MHFSFHLSFLTANDKTPGNCQISSIWMCWEEECLQSMRKIISEGCGPYCPPPEGRKSGVHRSSVDDASDSNSIMMTNTKISNWPSICAWVKKKWEIVSSACKKTPHLVASLYFGGGKILGWGRDRETTCDNPQMSLYTYCGFFVQNSWKPGSNDYFALSMSCLTSGIQLAWSNPHISPLVVRGVLASLCTPHCSLYESKPQWLFLYLILWPQRILYSIKSPLKITK